MHKILLTAFLFVVSAMQVSAWHEPTWKELAEMPGKSLYEGVYRWSPPHFLGCNIIDSVSEIGRSVLRAEYDALIVCDTLSGVQYKDRLVSLLGKTLYWTFSENRWKLNMLASLPFGHPDENKYRREEDYFDVFASSVYRDLNKQVLVDYNQIPRVWMTDESFFRYDEKLPYMDWTLSGESKEILGYDCFEAHTEFRGRSWTVWFTPEVSVDCGLWKFNGLPGLIMQAYDAKREYVFDIVGLAESDEAIVMYPKKESKITRADYRKMEKNAYDDPILFGRGADGYMLFIVDERDLTGREVFSPGHFCYPYNPIELE